MNSAGSNSLYLKVKDHFLSGRIFVPPSKIAIGKGVVFFYPFAGERIRVHRLYYCFASTLVQRGYSVFQFDYRGCGDSSGTWRDNTVESYLDDATAAVDYFTETMRFEQVGLFGLRFGATLASLFSESDDRIRFQILWEPIIDMKKYFFEALRVNLAAQVSAYRKVRFTRKDLIAQIRSGKSVNLDGYELSDPFFSSAENINLLEGEKIYSDKLILVNIVPPKRPLKASMDSSKLFESYRKNCSDIELAIVHSEQFWTLLKNYYPISGDLFDRTIQLL